MTLEQARVIIGNDAHFRTWQQWMEMGRPGINQFAMTTGRPKTTLHSHLNAAQLRINRWHMANTKDLHEEDERETEHAAECRSLSIITVAEGHDVRTLCDKVGKKILLRSA